MRYTWAMHALSTDEAKKLMGELTELSKKQFEALQTAAYFTMSKEEAKAFDKRHERIGAIRQLLKDYRDQ